jgi:hypothetical protein
LRGEPCPVLARADAVLHGLDPALGIAAAIRRRYPDLPVVAGQPRGPGKEQPPEPEGCTPLPCPASVRGQIDAVWGVLTDRRR